MPLYSMYLIFGTNITTTIIITITLIVFTVVSQIVLGMRLPDQASKRLAPPLLDHHHHDHYHHDNHHHDHRDHLDYHQILGVRLPDGAPKRLPAPLLDVLERETSSSCRADVGSAGGDISSCAGKSERRKKAEKATLVLQSAFWQKKCYIATISPLSFLTSFKGMPVAMCHR